MTRRVGAAERRARLGVRHRLAGPAADAVHAAASVVALHATDAATVFLAAAARVPGLTVPDVEAALYDDRTLVRMLGMRRTMFVVPVATAPVVQAACTDAVWVRERRLLLKHLAEAGLGDETWLKDVEAGALQALAARGSATAAQLSADEPRLRSQLRMAEGKAYEAVTTITNRVLNGLSQQGLIVRGRPRGTWISAQYHWSPADAWVPGGLDRIDAEPARVELARQWLRANGPGTLADLRWWTGWTATQVKAALAALDTVVVDLDDTPGVLLADDADPVTAPEPWVALLPALDPTVMAWQAREWFLGPHAAALFDNTGNPGPTIWADGRIVGGWAQRASDGAVVLRFLEDVDTVVRRRAAALADELTGWLAPVVVTPRFRTPLERELAGS